jgi:hypothetical protein
VRLFHCGVCSQAAYFENSLCLTCMSGLAFDPERREMVAVLVEEPVADGWLRVVGDPDDAPLRHRCRNAELARCNWLVSTQDGLCRSCALTHTRPADDDAAALVDFADAEGAKRRVLFTLFELGLPIVGHREQPDGGLAFDLLSSEHKAVMTGHAAGVITLDLDEADGAHREMMRSQLDEPYRTLLGHFRHEVGHYYWPIVVEQTGLIDRYRELFGDERESYADALQRHYAEGPPPEWPSDHVSAYSTMHPWEDWAETWAHYLHITDTSQTAAAHGLRTQLATPGDTAELGFRQTLEDWIPFTYAMNAICRSMGIADLYPFVLTPAVIEKLVFVDQAVRAAAAQAVAATTTARA